VTNLRARRRVFARMTTKLLASLAVAATLALIPAAAHARTPTEQPAASGIIAILIGLYAPAPFTPPIGSNKGS
jgi:hypothetical protein